MTRDAREPSCPGRCTHPSAFARPGQTKTKHRRLSVKLRSAFNKARGVPIEIDLAPYLRTVARIHAFRDDNGLEGLPDSELKRRFLTLAERLKTGTPPQEVTVKAFALVDEAARRTLGLIPHDVQLIAGLAMCGARVAELPTGEGKTLAAVFPACLAAVSGRGVHILTFNDYLARRDAAWMGPAYRLLGLSVGAVQEGMAPRLKREAYACDVTYGTAKEAGFDFLRDQLVHDGGERVHRPFHQALVDEADSILIDEARVPLVISGVAGAPGRDAARLAGLVRKLAPGRDFETDEARTSVSLTDPGLEELERRLGCASLYAPENEGLLAAVYCALHAEALLRRDVDYIVRNDRIEIVDEFTGRVMDKRHWPDGLQDAVEAKENLLRKSGGRVLGSITLQHFLGLYPRLCGMTATASPSAAEFREFYGLSVTVVPSHRPCVRIDHPDAVYTHREAKTRALVREIASAHASGRPVLVGTLTVKESEELGAALKTAGVACAILNAKNDELEARIIAGAGRPGAVTISTNMAGRGTDIKLGGPNEEERERVVALGGLYVIGTNRHESLRIDRQLRGRAGRQGDPGASRFFVSLEDEIFERYGLRRAFIVRHRLRNQDAALENEAIRREIVHAQKIIEGRNFDTRRSLRKFSFMIETQRRIVADWRNSLLASEDGAWPGERELLDPAVLEKAEKRFGREELARLRRHAVLFHLDRAWAEHLACLTDIREGIHLVSLGGREPADEFMRAAAEAFEGMEERIQESAAGTLASLVSREGPIDLEAEGFKGPSSTWTYLVDDDRFGWGMELIMGKNIGFSAVAAAAYGPLLLLTLIVKRLFGRKSRSRKT